MKINNNTKIKTPCKPRKYWFDRRHKWNMYNNTRRVWAICRHCMMALELLGEDDL